MILKYIIKENKHQSINQILKQEFKISARLQHKLITSKQIFLNGNQVDSRILPQINDVITVNLDFNEESKNIIPTQMSLNIVYEDEALLILDKPAGIAVHPSILHYTDSLANGVKYYFDSIGLKRKIRPVNRLDLNTSGLIVFAKNDYVQECLIQQMQNNEFKKEYLAIVHGVFEKAQGTISLPIARKENSIIERHISENGQEAVTHYEVLKTSNDLSLVHCTLQTGRTHQIRVHMSAIGHPLVGDTLYGPNFSDSITRQALHSYKISFIHPISHNPIIITSKLPEDMEKVSYEIS